MLKVPDFAISEQLHQGSRAVVFRALRERDGLPVVLKAPRNPRPSPAEAARLHSEHRLGRMVEHPAVIRYLELTHAEHRPVLVMEDIGGRALSGSLAAEGGLGLERFLELALQLAEGLAALHQLGIIHRDVNPSNIILDETSGRIKIVDLGIASLLAHTGDGREAAPPQQIEGTLRYISPEQTGRVNRSVDHRTDLYSLGVTCYELLAGRVPFAAQDPLELVHAHIARTPPPLTGVPEVVADIVARLLAKTASERYQSADGLAADLRRCRDALAAEGQIPAFPLAQRDVSARFALPERLFGREAELEQLLAAFERARDGGRILLTVSGRSGTGKTALLHELQRPFSERGGWFVASRFDRQRGDTPHSAFLEIGAELVRRLLTHDEDRVATARARVLQAVGDAGQVLVDALPELELLIGPQPPATDLPHLEAEQRFGRLVCAFFRAFCGPRHPLVLLLDDLHWADPASLKLIKTLMADRELHHLLLVGCYRPEELTPTHPLAVTLRAVAEGPAAAEQLELGPLQVAQLAALLAETLGAEAGAVEALAATLHDKTLGNPLFVTQLLSALHAEGLLRFDAQERAWRWEADAIAEREVSDDVAELLLARMGRLPAEARQVIELAACVGRRFDVATLAALAERPASWIAEAMLPALEGGILRARCQGFGRLVATLTEGSDPALAESVFCEFVHGRFQQAAYDRIPAERRRALHLRLGRMLRATLDDEALQEQVFTVVRHFGAGVDGLEDAAERLEVARLFLVAGSKAVGSAAYDAAMHHFENGVRLLPEQRWERHYELTFELTLQLYGCRVNLRAPHEEGLSLGLELLEHARSLTDRMRALAFHVVDLARALRVREALELGAATLREVGYELLPEDLPQAIQEGHDELQRLLGERSFEDLLALPPMNDPEQLAVKELLGAMTMPMYMRHRELLPLQTMALVRLSLEHGTAPGSAMAYCSWGKVLAHTFGDYAGGYAFCRLGRQLADASGDFRAGPRLMSGLVDWVRDPLGVVLDRVREGFRIGIESGERGFAALCAAGIPTLAFCAGVPLEPLRQESLPLVDFIEQHQGDVGVREVHLTLRFVEALVGRRRLTQALFDSEQEAERALEVMRVRNTEGVVWYHVLRARLALMLDDARTAQEQAELAYPHVDWEMGAFASYDLDFIHALALAGCAGRAEGDERAGLLARLEQRAAQLQGWVDAGAGTNLRHKALLVVAEICRVRGDRAEVGAAYERAIEAAAASGMLQDQALGNELAARHYEAAGMEKVARVYLQEAHYCYQKWGAAAKLTLLERAHPFLGAPDAGPGTTVAAETQTSRTTTGDRPPQLDYTTVLEASRAISGEVVLASLLQKLLVITASSAGAERAFLLLRRGRALTVEAGWEPDEEGVRLLDGAPVEGFDKLSAGVVNLVSRTSEAVVLGDAAREGRFQSDPYITRSGTRSLLCTPLLNQGRLVGLLYLENNLVSGAFSAPARLELIDLLCSQAAVSIDNASLYAGLEQKVEERTRDLARKNELLNESLERQQQMQRQLLISEKMASLGNLVAGVAHELNTPIGAVVASTDTAARALEKLRAQTGELGDEGRARSVARLLGLLEDNHRVIRTAGERVSEIVRTLRNFARLDEAERKPADLHEGLDATLDLLHHRIKRGVEVVKEYGELPQVFCYPNQLNQVFMNLLNNAVDAIVLREPGGSGTGTIGVRTWLADGLAHVAITDDGAGIPTDTVDRIFDPGFTTKGVGVGTGLGLSICFSIVDKHGGAIEVQSTPGRGSTFTVKIPVGA